MRKQKTSARLPPDVGQGNQQGEGSPEQHGNHGTAHRGLEAVPGGSPGRPGTQHLVQNTSAELSPGAMLSRTSRAIGTTLSPDTSTTRATKTTRSPLTWIRRGSGEPGFTPCPSAKGGYSPKTSANFFLFCSAFASAISASSGMSFIDPGDGNPAAVRRPDAPACSPGWRQAPDLPSTTGSRQRPWQLPDSWRC